MVTSLRTGRYVKAMSYGNAYDSGLRARWKYGCSRGVFGTPQFMVNGVMLAAQPTWTVKDWRAVIDPLIA